MAAETAVSGGPTGVLVTVTRMAAFTPAGVAAANRTPTPHIIATPEIPTPLPTAPEPTIVRSGISLTPNSPPSIEQTGVSSITLTGTVTVTDTVPITDTP